MGAHERGSAPATKRAADTASIVCGQLPLATPHPHCWPPVSTHRPTPTPLTPLWLPIGAPHLACPSHWQHRSCLWEFPGHHQHAPATNTTTSGQSPCPPPQASGGMQLSCQSQSLQGVRSGWTISLRTSYQIQICYISGVVPLRVQCSSKCHVIVIYQMSIAS